MEAMVASLYPPFFIPSGQLALLGGGFCFYEGKKEG